MQIQTFLALYAVSIPIFFLIDLLWIGVLARSLYQKHIGHLMEISWTPAVLFYLMFLFGLTLFASYPAIQNGGWKYALLWGALFGFFTYATHGMTNLATLKDWSTTMVVIDILWGTVLGASVAALTVFLYSLF